MKGEAKTKMNKIGKKVHMEEGTCSPVHASAGSVPESDCFLKCCAMLGLIVSPRSRLQISESSLGNTSRQMSAKEGISH